MAPPLPYSCSLYLLGLVLLENSLFSKAFSVGGRSSCTFSNIICRRFSSSSSATALHLFAFHNPNSDDDQPPTDKKKEQEEEEEEDIDFPNWMRGLSQQWPLHPAAAAAAEDSNKDDDSSGNDSRKAPTESSSSSTDTFLNPLSRILNMEALLKFSEKETNLTATLTSMDTADGVISPLDQVAAATNTTTKATSQSWNMTSLEELSAWDKWVGGLRQSVTGLTAQTDSATAYQYSRSAAEGILKTATARIESLVAATALSPAIIQDLILRASQTLQSTTLIEAAKQLAVERGLDVGEAAERARQTTAYAANLVAVADRVLRKGYVAGDPISKQKQNLLDDVPAVDGSRALFADFESATEINTFSAPVEKAAEMGFLAGAIYEETIPRTHGIGHTIVAQGKTEDIVWTVTDSIANRTSFPDSRAAPDSVDPFLTRTITIRGFDASDEEVDRDELLVRICTATPEEIQAGDDDDVTSRILVHSGLMDMARAIYKDVKQYVDWTSPSHRIVLNGHSVGGSLSLLLLFLMSLDRGADFVQDKVLRVFMFGSPPVTTLPEPSSSFSDNDCAVLGAFGLPPTLVHAYLQPWDPILRLFTEIDALYPLVGDVGDDGVTPFASGPPRTLRPITKAILEAWNGWPRFRDRFKGTVSQNYTSVGVQHLLLPDPSRYLADRFVSVNIPVPPVETVLRISSAELHAALETIFPLDVFEISFVPQAIRGFVHHFYPAYGLPLVDYAKRLERRSQESPESARVSSSSLPVEETQDQRPPVANGVKASPDPGIDWGRAAQWLQGQKLG